MLRRKSNTGFGFLWRSDRKVKKKKQQEDIENVTLCSQWQDINHNIILSKKKKKTVLLADPLATSAFWVLKSVLKPFAPWDLLLSKTYNQRDFSSIQRAKVFIQMTNESFIRVTAVVDVNWFSSCLTQDGSVFFVVFKATLCNKIWTLKIITMITSHSFIMPDF